MAHESVFPFPIPAAPPSVRPRSAPFTIPPPRDESGAPPFSLARWTADVPYPLLFIAGAAIGVLIASLVVAVSHRVQPFDAQTQAMTITAPAMQAPAAPVWQPPVVTIVPAPIVEDAPPAAAIAEPPPPAATPARAAVKRAVARTQQRRASRPKSNGSGSGGGDLLAAAL